MKRKASVQSAPAHKTMLSAILDQFREVHPEWAATVNDEDEKCLPLFRQSMAEAGTPIPKGILIIVPIPIPEHMVVAYVFAPTAQGNMYIDLSLVVRELKGQVFGEEWQRFEESDSMNIRQTLIVHLSTLDEAAEAMEKIVDAIEIGIQALWEKIPAAG